MSLTPELAFAQSLAKEVGAIMLQNFKLDMDTTWKADNSPLTITDTTINSLVIAKVREKFPDHAVLGEEENSDFPSLNFWVVDPLDGTIPFSHGVPTFAFSLALVKDGKPDLGVIFDPILDRMLWAQTGKGAFMNGNPISVSNSPEISHTVIDIDGPLKGLGAATDFSDAFPAFQGQGAMLSKFSSQVYGGLLVALGEYSGAVCNGTFPWDIAALKVIVEEAGGKVTDLHGEEQRYDQNIQGAIVSNGKVHDKLVDIVKKFAKPL